ncbi:hypothetical protein ACU4GR_06770 [Methylobacterium oryzae CBMB20]
MPAGDQSDARLDGRGGRGPSGRRRRLRGFGRGSAYLSLGLVVATLIFLMAGNLLLATARNLPYRALDPRNAACEQDAETGWDLLASEAGTPKRVIGNDEWAAIDAAGPTPVSA